MIAFIFLFNATSLAGGRRRPAPVAPPDPHYALALAAANRFLHAWQAGDLETGMVLLSDRARHAQNPEKFEQFFSSGGERAYEIARGRGAGSRYRFSAALVTSDGSRLRRRFAEIVVVSTGKNEWLVDKLP